MKNKVKIDSQSLHSGMDDLDYLAEAGESKVQLSTTDFEELTRRMDLNFTTSIYLGMYGILLSTILVVVSIIFLVLPNSNSQPIRIKSPETKNKFDTPVTVLPESSSNSKILKSSEATELRTENFVLKRKVNSKKESDTKFESEIPVYLEPLKIQTISTGTNETDLRTNEIYNAPVYDILGFKITNYDAYYFKSGNPFLITSKGKSAPEGETKDWHENDRSLTTVEVLKDALSFLSTTNYGDCLSALELLQELNPNDVNSLFYSGLCFHFLGKHQLALGFFSKVENHSNNVFHQEASFYSAVSYFEMKDFETARQLFEAIVRKKGFYASRAADYLK
jgi:tetratricopeptide (TPR) repeat protein